MYVYFANPSKGVYEMNLKLKRNLWLFSGTCFILALSFSMMEARPFSFYYVISSITCVLCFMNAYIFHKKIG